MARPVTDKPPILYTAMTHTERNDVDTATANAASARPDDNSEATQNARRASARAQAGTNWAWARDTGHYDWMDSHAPFFERS